MKDLLKMKTKILILLGNLDRCNGITSYVMNYYKKINHNKFSIDFIITENKIDDDYKKLIESNNSKIIYIKSPSIKTIFSDLNNIKKYLSDNLNKYDIFYCHLLNQGYFYLKYAKKLGFKKRVFHSHNIVMREKNPIRDFRNQLFKKLVSKEADYYLACSNIAGVDLLGNKRKFLIINNAIELNKFVYNIETRDKIRKKYNLENKLVFVQVGRLDFQKNCSFSIKLIDEYKNYVDRNIKLLFIGSGEEEQELKSLVKEKKLEEYISFLGTKNNVNEFLNASDIFLFPSRFEGLGIVAIEAQVSGLPCYISKNVPIETKMIDTTKYIDINNMSAWINTISETNMDAVRGDYTYECSKKGFNIDEEVIKLEKFFKEVGDKK